MLDRQLYILIRQCMIQLPKPMPDPTLRLHVFLAHLGFGSRRQIEDWIRKGTISVNGRTAVIGQKIDPAQDNVSIDGRPVNQANKAEPLTYIIMNKPMGVVSTVHDDLGRRTVIGLLPKMEVRLYPVGRLDADSEGLILVTNDGDVAYRMTHPKFGVPKTYQAKVNGRPTSRALQFLRKGVKLREGWVNADEATVIDHEGNASWVELTIHDGRQHQVKRMLERAGYPVEQLIRISMGPLTLDQLDGEPWKQLSDDEGRELRRFLHLPV